MTKQAEFPSPSDATLPSVDFYRPANYGPEDSVGYLMRRIIANVSQEIDTELEPSGLTHAQWMPLFALARGKADTGAALSRVCQLDAGATTRMLDRLEDKRLIQRERSAADRRVVHLHLTPDGEEAAAKVAPALCRVHNAALAGFSREEWESLKSMLKRMLDNIETMKAQRQNHEQ